ncbi:MAG: DUF2442 domain-containing protein [Bacillota bacterium]
MNTLNNQQAPLVALDVWFENDLLCVRLSDGREIGVPVEWFPRLKNTTAKERANWRFIGRGIGIRWDDLDEDIPVGSLVCPELYPLRAFIPEERKNSD